MRVFLTGVICVLLVGCSGPKITLDRVPADSIDYSKQAVLASTMEVRIDTSAVGKEMLEDISVKRAIAMVTLTQFLPEQGKIVPPVLDSRFEGNSISGYRFTTVYSSNSYRQAMWVDHHDKVALDRRAIDAGWYTVFTYGSTAEFDIKEPQRGNRSCIQHGGKLAPGVQPIELKAGEIGYFGHFVITIAMLPGEYSTSAFELKVADATIEPAPKNLDALISDEGFDPRRVRRVAASNFPCPWAVPR